MGASTLFPTFADAARASGKRLDPYQRTRIAECDRDTRSAGIDLMLRGGKRLSLARTDRGVTWEVI